MRLPTIDPENDTVIAAWGDHGEAGPLVWILVQRSGEIEIEVLYEKDFTQEILALLEVSKTAHRSMTQAIRSKFKAYNH